MNRQIRQLVTILPCPCCLDALWFYFCLRNGEGWENEIRMVLSQEQALALLEKCEGTIFYEKYEALKRLIVRSLLPPSDPGPEVWTRCEELHKQNGEAMKLLTEEALCLSKRGIPSLTLKN